MKQKIKSMFTDKQKIVEIILYIIFGGLTTLISIISYRIMTQIFETSVLIAQIISWLLAVSFAFVTNKFFVFRPKVKENSLKEAKAFVFGRLATGLLELLLLFLLIKIIGMDDFLSKIVATVITIILNYFWSKFAVFSNE